MAKPSVAAAILMWLSGCYKSIVFFVNKMFGMYFVGWGKMTTFAAKIEVFYYFNVNSQHIWHSFQDNL